MRNLKITFLALALLGICSAWILNATVIPSRKLRHVVAFKFKPEVSSQQMQRATENFFALRKKIPQIIELEGGPDVNFQKKSGKFTHCFLVTVKNEEDLATYGGHPDHQAFSKSVDPMLAEVMVVDYWVE